jgi:hypothetical protein
MKKKFKKDLSMFLIVFSLAILFIFDAILLINSFFKFMNPFNTLKIIIFNTALGIFSYLSYLWRMSI